LWKRAEKRFDLENPLKQPGQDALRDFRKSESSSAGRRTQAIVLLLADGVDRNWRNRLRVKAVIRPGVQTALLAGRGVSARPRRATLHTDDR
jgi:hypothetical protein